MSTNLKRWRPFETFALAPLAHEMSELWKHYFEEDGGSLFDWRPTADLIETLETFVVKLEAPGMGPEDIQVTLSGDVLTIKGEKKSEEKRDEDNWHYIERSYGSFLRTFTLPGATDPDAVEADMDRGILEVRVMKSKESHPTRVKVNVK